PLPGRGNKSATTVLQASDTPREAHRGAPAGFRGALAGGPVHGLAVPSGARGPTPANRLGAVLRASVRRPRGAQGDRPPRRSIRPKRATTSLAASVGSMNASLLSRILRGLRTGIWGEACTERECNHSSSTPRDPG